MFRRFLVLLSVSLAFLGCFTYKKNVIQKRDLPISYVSERAGVKIIMEEAVSSITGKYATVYTVKIANSSTYKILIGYKQFRIFAQKTGHHYCALPPYEIFGPPAQSSAVLSYPFPLKHSIRQSNFLIAPFCARMYPEIPVFNHVLVVDSSYYSRYFKKLAVIKPFSEKILSGIIPDGVLDTGGYIVGSMYFEKIRERDILFQMELIDAEKQKLIDNIQIRLSKK